MSRRIPRDSFEFSTAIAEASMAKGPQVAVDMLRAALDNPDKRPSDVTRADVLGDLGEYLQLSGDIDGAERAFRDAVAEDSEAQLDPRASLLSWCLEHGDRGEADELARAIRRSRPAPIVYDHVGESFEAAGDLAAATIWFTAGVHRAASDDGSDWEFEQLTVSRRRVRIAQGFPADEYDEMAAETLAERRADADALGEL